MKFDTVALSAIFLNMKNTLNCMRKGVKEEHLGSLACSIEEVDYYLILAIGHYPRRIKSVNSKLRRLLQDSSCQFGLKKVPDLHLRLKYQLNQCLLAEQIWLEKNFDSTSVYLHLKQRTRSNPLAILESLKKKNGGVATSKQVREELGMENHKVFANAFRVLNRFGLVVQVRYGCYRLTDLGFRVLQVHDSIPE